MTTGGQDISETIRRLDSLTSSELGDVELDDDSLSAVVRADAADLRARLYACEILLRRDAERFLNVIGEATAAKLYAAGLREGVTTDLNPWAFLGMGDLGPMGLHLVACRGAAAEALAPLLDDGRRAHVLARLASRLDGDGNVRVVASEWTDATRVRFLDFLDGRARTFRGGEPAACRSEIHSGARLGD